MHENVRGGARRVLVIGSVDDAPPFSPEGALASDGMLILMEEDTERAANMRDRLSRAGVANHTVIGGDPRRMLYKLAGPFDVIFYNRTYAPLRPLFEKLLAADGVLITNGEP
jgi:predicted O-methyltransferase YrrM